MLPGQLVDYIYHKSGGFRWVTGAGSAGACDDALTDSLAYLVSQQLLPLVPELLREEKPIPVWALKVVEECLESLPATTIPTLER